MEKEVFIAEYERISAQVRELEEQLRSLRDEYINSNAPYPVGTKIKVIYPATAHDGAHEDCGIVQGWTIGPDDEVVPFLAKVKKDGTAHPTAKIYVCSWREHSYEVCD